MLSDLTHRFGVNTVFKVILTVESGDKQRKECLQCHAMRLIRLRTVVNQLERDKHLRKPGNPDHRVMISLLG